MLDGDQVLELKSLSIRKRDSSYHQKHSVPIPLCYKFANSDASAAILLESSMTLQTLAYVNQTLLMRRICLTKT